jgi:cell division protein FtsQ
VRLPGLHLPRVHLRRIRRPRTSVAVAVVVAVLVGAAAGADAALHSRLFSATNVVVTGARHESTASIESATGLVHAPALLGLNTAAIAAKIDATFPWVESAQVSKSWPHTVDIRITERRPVAEIRTNGGRWELVDVTGHRLGPIGGQRLPRLLYTARPAAQRRPILPAAATPGLLVAATLPAAFAWQVADVQVSGQGWVTLYLDTPVSFVLGPANDLGAKYEDVAAVIASTTLHTGDVVDVSEPRAMTVTQG